MLSKQEQIRNWLITKRNVVSVPLDWTEACIAWIEDCFKDSPPVSFPKLCDQVYQQWLSCDLRELESRSFPKNLEEWDGKFVDGIHPAQLHCVVDESVSFYHQVLKKQNLLNENATVTAEDETDKWQPKPSRMLAFYVCDGVQTVKAVEYEMLPHVSFAELLPGTKLLIKGKILCRNGILFLKRENIQLLGGEVESLAEEFNSLKILKQKLEDKNQNQETRPLRQYQRKIVNRTAKCDDNRGFGAESGFGIEKMKSVYGNCVVVTRPSDVAPGATVKFESLDVVPHTAPSNVHPAYQPWLDEDTGWESNNDYDSSSRNLPSFLLSAQVAPTIDPSVNFKKEIVPVNYVPMVELPLYQPFDPVTGNSMEAQFPQNAGPAPQSAAPQSTSSAIALQSSQQTSRRDLLAPASMQSAGLAMPGQTQQSELCRGQEVPFSTLYHILTTLVTQRPCKFRIKASISSLKSQLMHNSGRFWSLVVSLSDGSAIKDAKVTDLLLRKLIGFTAAVSVQLRMSAREQPENKKLLKQGILACQEKLKYLDEEVEIIVTPRLDVTLVAIASVL